MQTMLTAAEAIDLIRCTVRPLEPIDVPLEEALGRVLAADVVADRTVPSFDNASMDGFALGEDDGVHQASRRYRVIGEAAAGRPYAGPVRPGEAVRIMTGAVIPEGTTAVLEVEQVEEQGGTIRFDRWPDRGRNIRKAGEDLKHGDRVLATGTRLRPPHLGVLASLGRSTVRVRRQPRAAVITTGSELVATEGNLAEGQIFNSSAVVIPAMAREARTTVSMNRNVADEPEAMRAAFRQAAEADLLVTTGGVSAGAHDLVMAVLRSLGVTFHFWKVRIKPGMPLAFGTWSDGRPVICLPGNPVSSAVTFQQFVRPLLDALEGSSTTSAIRVSARLEHEIRKTDGKRHFSRGIAVERDGEWTVRTTGAQSSGMLSSLALANCLIVIPEAAERLMKGDRVEVEWL